MTDFEQFENYLADQLTADERAAFEQRLKNDPEFSEAFRQYQSIQLDMQQWQQAEPARSALKQTLQSITEEHNKKAKVRSMRWYLWRAAAMLIIAAAVWWLLLPPSKNNKELYAEFASGETLSFTRGNATDSLWDQVSGWLYDKKYKESITPLQTIISMGKDSMHRAAMYLGYAYMQTGEDALAEKTFNSIPGQPGEGGDQLRWYKALLYLKTDRERLSKQTLDTIAASYGDYVSKANRLLKAMR